MTEAKHTPKRDDKADKPAAPPVIARPYIPHSPEEATMIALDGGDYYGATR